MYFNIFPVNINLQQSESYFGFLNFENSYCVGKTLEKSMYTLKATADRIGDNQYQKRKKIKIALSAS